jgi:hypothetical protein
MEPPDIAVIDELLGDPATGPRELLAGEVEVARRHKRASKRA